MRPLDRAAQRLANGENANDAKQQAYREIRDYLTGQIRPLSGVPQGDGGRAEGLGKAGSREASPGQHDQAVAPAPDPQGELRAQLDKARAENAALKARKAGNKPGSGAEPFGQASLDQAGLFGSADEEQSREDAGQDQAKLLHDQLTAQIKSGLPARTAKLKAAKNRGLFDEPELETGSLFARDLTRPLPKNAADREET